MRVDRAYNQLRDKALSLTGKQLSVPPDWPAHTPFGVVMDIAPERGVATLTSFLSGDASLYYSTGGGLLGGIGQPKVNEAARAFVTVSSQFASHAAPAPDRALPTKGQVFFYFLTMAGLRRIQYGYEDLMSGKGPLVPLFVAGQDVITQFRLLQEAEDR